jgi:hypothetical protein
VRHKGFRLRADFHTNGGVDTTLSLLMFAALASVAGAVFYWRREGRMTRQVWLLLVLAMVMLGNVLIWAVPVGGESGASPTGTAAR